MNILYQCDEYIVCIKPVGVASQESECENMPDLLKKELSVSEIYPVHRLDTAVSGIMVYAKTKKCAAYLSNEILNNRFHKTYIALTHGNITPEKGRMEDLLFKDSQKNKSFVVKRERKGVKKAMLEYEVIQHRSNLSLVKIKLITGRTHQIRVQFASRKYPLCGDGKYGAKDNYPKLMLFSKEIAFTDPETGEFRTFSAEPEGFK